MVAQARGVNTNHTLPEIPESPVATTSCMWGKHKEPGRQSDGFAFTTLSLAVFNVRHIHVIPGILLYAQCEISWHFLTLANHHCGGS